MKRKRKMKLRGMFLGSILFMVLGVFTFFAMVYDLFDGDMLFVGINGTITLTSLTSAYCLYLLTNKEQ